MDIFRMSCIIGMICNFGLTLFLVTFRGKEKPSNMLFAGFTFSGGIWNLGGFMFTGFTQSAHDNALFWMQVSYMGAIYAVVFFYHFITYYLNLKRTILTIVVYATSVIFSFFNWYDKSRYFLGDLRFVPKFQFYWLDALKYKNPLYFIFYIGFFWLLLGYSFFLMIKAFDRSSGQDRNKLKYFAIAVGFGWIGTNPLFLQAFHIDIYPYTNFLVALYPLLVAYVIIRHQVMDIEIVIKKTLVFAFLFTIVFSIFVGITLLTQQFIAGGKLLGLALSSIIIIFAVKPLENFLVRVTNKYLFQKKYDYKQVLKSFIDEVITVLNLDRIIQSTLELLDKTLHPEMSAVLLLNQYEDKYISYKASGYDKTIILDNNSKTATFLKISKDIFSVENSDNVIKTNEELIDEMKKLNVRLAIPLMLHNDLIGIMLLGRKKSDEEYSKEDIDILTDLARTEAIAVGNAQLFAETAQNERRAAIGTLAAGINHEVGNPLNIINTKIQVYLMSLDRGLYKDKKPEDIIQESKDIMNMCLRQTTRISDITKKLSSFAKPSKEFKPELTDIEEQVDETLAVVGHELELERIEIKKDIKKPLSKILADKRQVQQIFFNIIKNAGQAIKENGIIEIRTYDSHDGNVRIEISDTGLGIPDDKLGKIYKPFFTTKEPSKGTGLGLSIVRQLVWRNKGDIKVKSKVGEGTTFTITFPAAK